MECMEYDSNSISYSIIDYIKIWMNFNLMNWGGFSQSPFNWINVRVLLPACQADWINEIGVVNIDYPCEITGKAPEIITNLGTPPAVYQVLNEFHPIQFSNIRTEARNCNWYSTVNIYQSIRSVNQWKNRF